MLVDAFKNLVDRMEILWAEQDAGIERIEMEDIGRVVEIRDIARTASDLLGPPSVVDERVLYLRAVFGAVELRAMWALEEWAKTMALTPEAIDAIAETWGLFAGLAEALRIVIAKERKERHN